MLNEVIYVNYLNFDREKSQEKCLTYLKMIDEDEGKYLLDYVNPVCRVVNPI